MTRVPTLPALLGLCATACFNPPNSSLTSETTTTSGDTTTSATTTTGIEPDSTSSSSVGLTTEVDPDTTIGPPGSTSTDTGETTTTGGTPEIEVSIGGRAIASGDGIDLPATVAVGEAGPEIEVTVANTGTADLVIAGVMAMGPDATHVTLDQAGLAAVIPPGDTSSFTATFTPQNGGQKQVLLSIGNDDDDESPYDVFLRGHTTENTYRLIETVGQPAPRFNATLEDLGDGRLLLFGGRDAAGAWLSDTWTFDVETDTWTQLAPPVSPPARNAHAMALVEPGTVILYGGSASMGGSPLGDTWAFDVATETWAQLAPPTSPGLRFQHEMVAIGSARALIFGGRPAGAGGELAETWIYDHAAGTWINALPAGAPTPASAYAFAFDGDDTVTRFGGFSSFSPLDQTWNYTISTNTWAQAAPMGTPGPRAVLSGEYLAAGQMIVFSGKLGDCCVDPTGGTFAYDRAANTWTTITPPGEPAPRFNYAMTRVAGNKAIFYGGALANIGVATAQGQTWEYVGPLP